MAPPRQSVFSPVAIFGWLLCLALLASDEWLLGPALFLLFAGWMVLSRDDGPPVIAAAFTYQWLQVTIALVYFAISGQRIEEMETSPYQPMVMIGLASVAAFFGGYYLVSRYDFRRNAIARQSRETRSASLTLIAASYIVAITVGLSLQRIAWSFPALTQVLEVLGFARYALLYVLTTRLLKPTPRWTLLCLVVGVEVALGFTGFFAEFRESLAFVGLAILAVANRRKLTTWIAVAAVAITAFSAAVTWTAIKPMVREQFSASTSTSDRLAAVVEIIVPAVSSPTTSWSASVESLVSRMWMIYYPALMLERVPSSLPHEGGALLRGAINNTLMPRAFFPDKGILASESDKVRKYSGIWVAGRESNTSFAFGYSAESYVDFGWPLMLVPILVFGGLLGLADRLIRLLIGNPEVVQGVRVVVLWSTMYLYETSWVIMIGTSVSLFVVLVGAAMLFERAFGLGRLARGSSADTPRPGRGRIPQVEAHAHAVSHDIRGLS